MVHPFWGVYEMKRPDCARGWLAVGVAGLSLLVAGEAWAQVEPGSDPDPGSGSPPPEWSDSYFPFARQGAYASVGGFFALENFDRDAAIQNGPLDISGDDGGGIDLRAGYRFYQYLAAEVIYQYYSGFAIKERISNTDDSFDGWSLSLNGKGFALLGAIQPYGVVGLGGLVFTEKRRDDSGFFARLGGGVDLYLTDHLVIEAEAAYVMPTGDLNDFQFATFGGNIQYRF